MPYSIRPIDANNIQEIELVAARMRETLVEVLGAERGSSMYSMEWLIDHVRFHLDPNRSTGAVFVLCENNSIAGHAIVRIEFLDEKPFGYFSTIYIEQGFRRHGYATTLMQRVEEWCRNQKLPRIVYNTATTNHNLLSLFQKHGYKITHQENNMAQLAKTL